MTVRFDELRVLKVAEEVADELWRSVLEWDDYKKDTVGKQLVRAADSSGANIAEAYGRYHDGENLQFLYYARGSLFETKYWINRALERQLLANKSHEGFANKLSALAHDINAFAKSFKDRRSSKKLREPVPVYELEQHSFDSEKIDIFSQQDLDSLSQISMKKKSLITNH